MKAAFFIFILLLTQDLYSQQLRYSICTNCDDELGNQFNGNMIVPQEGFTYGNIETLNNNPQIVVSDFGRREENSRWHIGIDINRINDNDDLGDILYPIETGTINMVFVSQNENSYKTIVVDGNRYFGYGHIFFDGLPDNSNGMRCGSFILKKMDYPHSLFYAIIYCPENGNPIAYGEVTSDNAYVSHPDVNNGLPLEISTEIASIDSPLCPLGNSGGDTEGHLHLYN